MDKGKTKGILLKEIAKVANRYDLEVLQSKAYELETKGGTRSEKDS